MIEDTDSGESVKTPALKVNVDPKILEKHQQINRSAGWQQLPRDWSNMEQVILLGGGPSLNSHKHELDELMKKKIPIVTVNGSYHWAMKNHIWPSVQIVMDGREWNKAFTHPVFPGTYYLIADTCHPEVLKGLPKKRTFLWNTKSVDGGSTVMLTAIPLLRWMGMLHCSIFGLDSCITDKHHAYSQPENDADEVLEVDIDGRVFKTTRWMIQQAEEALELHPRWGSFKVHGDGLIAWMLNARD